MEIEGNRPAIWGMWFTTAGIEPDVVYADSERSAMFSTSGHSTHVTGVTKDEREHPGDLLDYIPVILGALAEPMHLQLKVPLSDEFVSDIINDGLHPLQLAFDKYQPRPRLIKIDDDVLMPLEWNLEKHRCFVTIYRNHWVGALYPVNSAVEHWTFRTAALDKTVPDPSTFRSRDEKDSRASKDGPDAPRFMAVPNYP